MPNKTLAKNKEKELTVSQKQELEDWDKKLKSGEACKEAKKFVLKAGKADFDPEIIIRKIAKDILPKLRIKHEGISKEDNETLDQAIMTFGIENDLSILTGVERKYRGLILNLRRNLVKEFECDKYSEKILVDSVASAYARIISITDRLTHMAIRKEITALSNNYLSILSKEVDRANRHFLTALETLRQFKQPDLNINLKTKNAFIAQNQQFSNNQNKEDETIESK